RYKFACVLEIADSLIESGNVNKAKEILLEQCLVAARELDNKDYYPREAKHYRLIETARRLVGLQQSVDAENVLDEATVNLLPMEKRRTERAGVPVEDIALLLLELGKKHKAIDLLVAGWLNLDQSDLECLTPEEKGAIKLDFVMRHPTCQRFAKALLAREKK
ncbi:MAG: hypothetical protein WCT39_05520, partial [Candidatus Margulisiibacteriota bacterium]